MEDKCFYIDVYEHSHRKTLGGRTHDGWGRYSHLSHIDQDSNFFKTNLGQI
jgi:hypothetical protein